MKKINILLSALVLPILLLSSCNDFLKETPENFLTTGTDAVDKKFVEAQFQSACKAFLWYKNGRQGFIGISGTDEAVAKTVEANYWADQGAIDKYNTTLNSDNLWTKWMWDTGYFGANRCNNVILSARKDISGATDEWKKSMEAEARFLRASFYFMTTQFFGKIPLITEETKPSASPSYPREELPKIYQFIIDDLKFAEQNLKTAYRAGRPTVAAAKALLMKVYMYAPPAAGVRDYAKAKAEFEGIEALGVYQLESAYARLFQPEYENGPESVYEFQFEYPDEKNNFQKYCGSRIIGAIGQGAGYGIFLPSAYYLQSFESGDERFAVSVRTEFYDVDGKLITSSPDPEYIAPHCKKYEDVRHNHCDDSAKNIFFIRYADLILLYAECLNEAGNQAGAIAQINRVRERAKTSLLTAGMTKEALLDFIYEERMRELGMEGWRRFDLTRRGPDYFAKQVDTYNSFAKGNVKPYHALYPIPRNEINMNYGINEEDQNEGYN